MGGEEIEVAVRPKQQFTVLAKAWLKMSMPTEKSASLCQAVYTRRHSALQGRDEGC